MEKFNRSIRGYDANEVNEFLDQVIVQVENIIADNKKREEQFQKNLSIISAVKNENVVLKESLARFESMEEAIQNIAIMGQKTADEIKERAEYEADLIKLSAKESANRIVNASLVKAEKTYDEAARLRRNIIVYKKRLRSVIETQLDLIDDIEIIDF